jgi:multidrug resistance efflux pump
LSNQYDTEAQVNKLKNQYANYSIRNDLYYIRAAQNGYINRALQAGIGETIKEGTPIATVMPSEYDIAVETYVNPLDLPLISKGAKIRIWFDGWPTIVFSGWPDMSYGTLEAELLPLKNSLVIMESSEYLLPPNEDPCQNN